MFKKGNFCVGYVAEKDNIYENTIQFVSRIIEEAERLGFVNGCGYVLSPEEKHIYVISPGREHGEIYYRITDKALPPKIEMIRLRGIDVYFADDKETLDKFNIPIVHTII